MKQVLFISGGDSKYDHKDFEDYVNKTPYNPKYQNFVIWSKSLYKNLGSDYEIIYPEMPNKDFAEYKYWKIRFEQTFPYLNDDVIIAVHSLGGGFIAKYLNENDFPFNIKHIFIVSGTFEDGKYLMGDFNFEKTLKNFKKYEKITTFYHSKDDDIVSFDDMISFQNVMPNSEFKVFENRGHFIEEIFPEIEEDIKNAI